MSLEKAIEANTLALQNLLEALTKAAGLTGCADVDAAPFGPDHMALLEKAEAKKQTAAADEAATHAALVKAQESVAAPTGDKQWTYDELRTDFLALVKKNKPAALGILASFKVATLTELKDKDVFYDAIAAKIAEANNG